MSEEESPEFDGTIHQPEEALAESKGLSIPKEVERHASAPKIPGYILTHPIGRGAYAEVWATRS